MSSPSLHCFVYLIHVVHIRNLYLYHTTENTANHNTGKALYVLEGITLGFPIVHFAYVALIVLAIVFSMTWYKIVVQHSLVVYHGISYLQGSYRSWKTWKVMEFYNFIFQAWKVLKFRCGSWKVMENQYVFYE